MTTKHTPTPWRVKPTAMTGASLVVAEAEDGNFANGADFSVQFSTPNAEFIVRACNAHDDLVAALERTLGYLASCAGIGALSAHAQAIDALAKAKGE